MHTPVLLQETIEGLRIIENGMYVDATVGEGGHTKAILEKGGRVLGIDRDARQIDRLKNELKTEKALFINGNFADIAEIVSQNKIGKVDGVLFDLGLSWEQLSNLGKGLSYRNEAEPLDMRLDAEGEITAEFILNTYSQEELYELLARNSEEVRALDIAKQIVSSRRAKRYKKVGDLKQTIEKITGPNTGKTNNRVFQALRIEVNNEFENLKRGLEGAVSILKPEGRIAVISFHSLEDRIVKQFVRGGKLQQISKKAIQGDRTLSFERPARLRIFSL